jgi:hypothetical protein
MHFPDQASSCSRAGRFPKRPAFPRLGWACLLLFSSIFRRRHLSFGAFAAGLAIIGPPALADLAVTANDNHSVNVDGIVGPAKNPPPDSVSIIDVKQYPPKVVATVKAPASVVGAPTSIWIAPDESFVLVTGATKIEPQNPDRIVPDDRVSVIDLKASPPKLVQQVTAG